MQPFACVRLCVCGDVCCQARPNSSAVWQPCVMCVLHDCAKQSPRRSRRRRRSFVICWRTTRAFSRTGARTTRHFKAFFARKDPIGPSPIEMMARHVRWRVDRRQTTARAQYAICSTCVRTRTARMQTITYRVQSTHSASGDGDECVCLHTYYALLMMIGGARRAAHTS